MSRGQLEFIAQNQVKPKFFINCGAGLPGNGILQEAWHAKVIWPGIEVVGFEPHPLRYHALREAAYPGWLFRYALGLESDVRELKVIGPEWNSGFHWDGPGDNSHTVGVVRLDWIFGEHRPDLSDALLWLDIEGSERDALMGATETLKKTIAVVVEVRDEVPCPGWCTAAEVAEILSNAGFRKAKEFPSGPTDPQRDEVWLR